MTCSATSGNQRDDERERLAVITHLRTEPRKDRSGRREFVILDPDGNRLAFFTK